ncbi:hypothetical protein A3715_17605 [Oleiphilus sp. HI0009]|nr:hypothetical protein A3715_17605 [Oleiphilus sp. HI0009]
MIYKSLICLILGIISTHSVSSTNTDNHYVQGERYISGFVLQIDFKEDSGSVDEQIKRAVNKFGQGLSVDKFQHKDNSIYVLVSGKVEQLKDLELPENAREVGKKEGSLNKEKASINLYIAKNKHWIHAKSKSAYLCDGYFSSIEGNKCLQIERNSRHQKTISGEWVDINLWMIRKYGIDVTYERKTTRQQYAYTIQSGALARSSSSKKDGHELANKIFWGMLLIILPLAVVQILRNELNGGKNESRSKHV